MASMQLVFQTLGEKVVQSLGPRNFAVVHTTTRRPLPRGLQVMSMQFFFFKLRKGKWSLGARSRKQDG